MAGEWKRTSLRVAGVTLIDYGQRLSIRRDSLKEGWRVQFNTSLGGWMGWQSEMLAAMG